MAERRQSGDRHEKHRVNVLTARHPVAGIEVPNVSACASSAPHVTYMLPPRALRKYRTPHTYCCTERDTQDSTDELTNDTTFITFGRRCLVP